MPLSKELIANFKEAGPMMKMFLSILKGEPSDLTLDDLRAGHAEGFKAFPLPPNVKYEKVDMGGVAAIKVIPDEIEGGRTLLFAHGGAYIVGDSEGYKGLGGAFAVETKAIVYIPDYRLAPEHPFPVPIYDVVTSYRWLIEQGHDPRELAILGDSAGGAMTVSVMTIARDEGLPLPAGGVAMSPWSNLEHTGDSIVSRLSRDLIHSEVPEGLEAMADTFLAGAPKNSPVASPVFADLHGLPPILIQVGEAEQLLSDGMDLATRLGDSGVRVNLEVWPDMFHGWQLYHAELEEGAEAIENAARFLDFAFKKALKKRPVTD